MFFGSSARLTARIISTAPVPASSSRNPCLCRPMPCSPVQVPSSSSAWCTRCPFSRSAVSRFGGDGRIDQVGDLEVAVADMADDVIGQARRVGLGHRLRDAFGQPRDRHAGVGGHGAAAGLGLQRGEVGVVARGPQPGAFLGRRGPLEVLAALLARRLLHQLRLFLDAALAAVELHQQHWRLAQRELVVLVDRSHRVGVEQLAARDRHAELDGLDRGAHCSRDVGEAAHRRRNRLGPRWTAFAPRRTPARRDAHHSGDRDDLAAALSLRPARSPCRATGQTHLSSIRCSARNSSSRCRMDTQNRIRVLAIT